MRRALVLLSGSLALACSNEPTASPSPTATHPPATIAEVEPDRMPERSEPEYFFAVVGQTGVEHCPDGMSETWLDVQPTLGWTSASGPAAADLDPLMGLPVLARGWAGPAPERPPLPVEPQPCPIMQMRSDWVNTPQGIRARRTAPLELEHFECSSVRRLDELTVAVAGEQLVAEFRNPLPFALTDVRLRVHYEGCYGKPGTTARSSEPATLAPGETLRHAFPRIDVYEQPGPRKGGPPAREHYPAALVLEIGGSEGAEAKVWADLGVSLSALGLTFECP